MDPSQIVLVGFGTVSRTMMTLMLLLNRKLISLPILIIDPKHFVPVKRGPQQGGGNGDPIGKIPRRPDYIKIRHHREQIFTHETEDMPSEILAKLLEINPNITILETKLAEDNCHNLFEQYVKQNAIVIDLAYRVNTTSIVQECQNKQCVYVDTAIDDWKYTKKNLFSVKAGILNGIKYNQSEKKMTAVLNHGMNPGLVSHFMKKLLGVLAEESGDTKNISLYRHSKYNYLAQNLGLSLIQIAERDTQTTKFMSSEECFYNTWSVVGFIDEALLPAEVSWGTHESRIPYKSNKSVLHNSAQIILPVPGYQVRTRSYEPKGGVFTGYCIPHAECYSLANFLRVGDEYIPSVYYSYLVPDTTKLMCHYIEYSLNDQFLPRKEHVLRSDEIIGGYDSVGCLVFFRKPQLKKYWIGTILNNKFARDISPEINGTCLQVAISVLACVEWMKFNPYKGIIEPEEVDSDFIIEYCHEWLGEFYYEDVTDYCDIETDELNNLLTTPANILF